MCETLLTEFNEAQEYAEKCRQANEAYEKVVRTTDLESCVACSRVCVLLSQAEEAVFKEERQELERKKKWEETMDSRVEDWRDFKVTTQLFLEIQACTTRSLLVRLGVYRTESQQKE